MEYIVGNLEDNLLDEASLRRIRAGTDSDAKALYRKLVTAHCELFREHVLDVSCNMGFCSEFWLRTKAECDAFDRDGSVITPYETFCERVRAFFIDQPHCGEAYLRYYAAQGDEGSGVQTLPQEVFEYVAVRMANWDRLKVIPAKSMPARAAALSLMH